MGGSTGTGGLAALNRAGAITLSLALNAALLAILSLEDRRHIARRIAPSQPIYLDIEPVIRAATLAGPEAATNQRLGQSRQRERDVSQVIAPGVEPSATPAQSDMPPSPTYNSQWTVRPVGSTIRPEPQPLTAGSGQLACSRREMPSSQQLDRCNDLTNISADATAPLHRSGDEDRTADFARETAAKKRWRDYREGDGPYPDLLSLFGRN
jgi:hypothetical protein